MVAETFCLLAETRKHELEICNLIVRIILKSVSTDEGMIVVIVSHVRTKSESDIEGDSSNRES